MVRGLNIFKEHFREHLDQFVLIGGTACDIAMTRMGLNFRTTKDLDIVLIIEALDTKFSDCFWDLVKKGGYKNIQRSSGRKMLYRFYEPQNNEYPFMLELFSRKPDALEIPESNCLTPIPVDEESYSLSAILLDDDYYQFILSGRIFAEGLQLMPPEYLILLKVKAYLDLSARKDSGERIDSKDIRKHKNDIFRLTQVLTPNSLVNIPKSIAEDQRQFLDRMRKEPPDLRNLEIKSSLEVILRRLQDLYHE